MDVIDHVAAAPGPIACQPQRSAPYPILLKIIEKVVMYKIDMRGGGGVQKSYTKTDPPNFNLLYWEKFNLQLEKLLPLELSRYQSILY